MPTLLNVTNSLVVIVIDSPCCMKIFLFALYFHYSTILSSIVELEKSMPPDGERLRAVVLSSVSI